MEKKLKENIREKLKEKLTKGFNITILTGAGISAESGIKTFRDSNGLWENHPVEEVATPEAFQRNPKLVYQFYNARREQLNSDEVKPNQGHFALADLFNKASPQIKTTLITQNVDDLHERSGIVENKVWHMHGELQKMRCVRSGKDFPAPLSFNEETVCDCCGLTRGLRPHIVWFGEMPFFLDESYEVLQNCDLFLSIGTSGHVYPAANFVSLTPEDCIRIEFNVDATQISQRFDYHFLGPSGETLPRFVHELLELT